MITSLSLRFVSQIKQELVAIDWYPLIMLSAEDDEMSVNSTEVPMEYMLGYSWLYYVLVSV
jgi:hypothetical protein